MLSPIWKIKGLPNFIMDEDMGTWGHGLLNMTMISIIVNLVIHIIRCSHYICVYGAELVSTDLTFDDSLSTFNIYYGSMQTIIVLNLLYFSSLFKFFSLIHLILLT